MAAKVDLAWAWTGPAMRHTLRLSHNQITGGLRLTVDGADVENSSWRFKLTKAMTLLVEGQQVELLIRPTGTSERDGPARHRRRRKRGATIARHWMMGGLRRVRVAQEEARAGTRTHWPPLATRLHLPL
jgi:hypothetical protein